MSAKDLKIFLDYQDLVLEYYLDRKDKKVLSGRLINPTPANLRDECAAKCRRGINKKDEKTLQDVFEPQSDLKSYVNAIENFPIDKFKPLLKFMKGGVRKPDEKNVELLAWLIDFEPRPWQIDWNTRIELNIEEKYDNVQENVVINRGSEQDSKNRNTVVVENISSILSSRKSKNKVKRIALLSLLLLLLAGGSYLFYVNIAGTHSNNQEGCMYWSGDHYESVACNKEFGNTLKIAFDSARYFHFKMITKEDTITYASIGRVWYSKMNNKLEYYTAEGYHPIYIQVKLKPITAHIIDTYIKKRIQ